MICAKRIGYLQISSGRRSLKGNSQQFHFTSLLGAFSFSGKKSYVFIAHGLVVKREVNGHLSEPNFDLRFIQRQGASFYDSLETGFIGHSRSMVRLSAILEGWFVNAREKVYRLEVKLLKACPNVYFVRIRLICRIQIRPCTKLDLQFSDMMLLSVHIFIDHLRI